MSIRSAQHPGFCGVHCPQCERDEHERACAAGECVHDHPEDREDAA